jgi:hypothetical protein
MSVLGEPVRQALQFASYVSGFTHGFYRYPARFSPQLARAFIHQYTQPGDVVLDPFMGGGTTVVEAIAAGRRVIGLDLNPLAHFVTLVKTTPLSLRDMEELRRWACTTTARETPVPQAHPADPRLRNLPLSVFAALTPYTRTALELRPSRRRRFARCVLLHVGQWALESRQQLPSAKEIQVKIVEAVDNMLDGLEDFIAAAAESGVNTAQIRRNRRLLNTTTALGYWLAGARRTGIPRLVLTSPPYPGVHVLYHRWQVLGRRETPAPFWLADLQDGHGESYYRFGSRTPTGMENYYATLRTAFTVVRRVLGPDTLVAQLLAFGDVGVQLPAYLAEMETAGYAPVSVGAVIPSDESWRRVPHRRWYMRVNDPGGLHETAQEVLLLHRIS